MASAVLSTMHHVSARKLEKLDEARTSFDAEKKRLIQVINDETDQATKISKIVDALEKLGRETQETGLMWDDFKRYINQSRQDSSVGSSTLKSWQTELENLLNIKSLKNEYACLFGQLVNEWIQHSNGGSLTSNAATGHRNSDASGSSAGFEEVGREEMHEQRKKLESYIFNERQTDKTAIKSYLEKLFGSTSRSKKLKQSPIEQLRENVKELEVADMRVDASSVSGLIDGILRSDLFSGRKREDVLDIRNQPTLWQEVADVINMDLDSLSKSDWSQSPVTLELRRHLNGKYRAFSDEDIHRSLLLHQIGKKWAAKLRVCFNTFYHSGAWRESPFRAMSREDRLRREYFLAEKNVYLSVRNSRKSTYCGRFFMSQLEDSTAYTDDGKSQTGDTISPKAINQLMLHLATTEVLLNRNLYGGCTVLQSDFEWFGPSIPHSTIFAVLEFFDFEESWLTFFEKFLQRPLAFAQDGPQAEAQVRKRGVPVSHTLSDVLTELILFCLDFAVKQRTKGQNIYRIHDDLWFWGQDSSCVEAWKAIQEFSDVMGLSLNMEKTGAVRIGGAVGNNETLQSALPSGEVRWGFLRLSSDSGEWIVDKGLVDRHVEELKRQLALCHSVFAWVQAWNSYVMRFFSNNLGEPARCLGQKHVQSTIDTFEYLQQKLFGTSVSSSPRSASVTDYLRKVIAERFGVSDLPDGFFFFPVELGGLGLQNPFVELFTLLQQMEEDDSSPEDILDGAYDKDKELYEESKVRFETGEEALDRTSHKPKDDSFMSLDEYMRFREETSPALRKAYEKLTECPKSEMIHSTTRMTRLVADVKSSGIAWAELDGKEPWSGMTPYWKCVLQMYSAEVVQRFGSLNMCDAGMLPIGLVKTLRSEKFRWQG